MFGAGIRQLQCILLKVALLLGVRVFEGLGFEELIPPPVDQTEREWEGERGGAGVGGE